MKKIFTAVFSLCLTLSSFGQIEIYKTGEDVDVSGTVVEITGNETSPHIDFDVKNSSDATLNSVSIRRFRVEEREGTKDYLCWGADMASGSCYGAESVSGSNPWQTPDRANLSSGSSGWLSSHHVTNGLGGCVTYRYYVLDASDSPLDSVDVRYCGSLAVDEDEKNLKLSVFPNPANEVVNVSVSQLQNNVNYTFKLYSVIGNQLINNVLVDGNNSFDLKSLPNGVYFCSILKDGNVVETKKIVVKH